MSIKYNAIATIVCLLLVTSPFSADFDDTGWDTLYIENFDIPFEAIDGQQFGSENWLIFQLLNGGSISVANGYAQLNAPDFYNAALIRSTQSLPDEYKIRTKIGYINYDLTNYEQADYDDPNFDTHNGYYENGMYFLTITNDTCIGNQCAEDWWHYHRKMVIDVDNHLNGGGGETFHPVFMVYMAPEINSGGNLLRTWTGTAWDSSSWNWNVAHTYDYNSWYYAELERKDGTLTLRLYDENKNIIQSPTPVTFDKIFAINDSLEFLYLGEPHTDDYEGDVRIDEITLLIPKSECCIEIRGNVDGSVGDIIDIEDLVYMVDYQFRGGAAPPCLREAELDGDGIIDISDLVYMVDYQFRGGLPPVEC